MVFIIDSIGYLYKLGNNLDHEQNTICRKGLWSLKIFHIPKKIVNQKKQETAQNARNVAEKNEMTLLPRIAYFIQKLLAITQKSSIFAF